MPFITLAVTVPVIQQVNQGHDFQMQLAIRDASTDLSDLIRTANAENKVTVLVCGVFMLFVGDTGAIWRSHQNPGSQTDDFDNLYSLLARRPDVSVTFRW